MSIKTNFQTQTVTASKIVFNFDEMKTLQTMFEDSAIEAATAKDSDMLESIKSIAGKVGLDIDIDIDTPIEVGADGVKSLAKHADGESSLDGLTEAELIAELES